MTNAQLIMREAFALMQAGKLRGSGQFVTIDNGDGEAREIELPEAIHTFSAWKKAGFTVKRGEHAVACFPVWKYSERRNASADGEAEEETSADGETAPAGYMRLRKAFFFSASQVEPLTARK